MPTETTGDSKAIEIPQGNNILNKTTHDENDTSENKSVTELDLPAKENGEQYIEKQNKHLSTNFAVKIEN